ncbi:EscU/YscU/HrcU family type III secretion system export apparatus switch protein [Nocardioides flavescens]|uniref:Flagellar type III secretion system protein FlhB n=1 Tax=Nocardioides flavescens TaxID=2691959 RepID=A0A6L7EVD6_9ACTN|nr:EscU/YscU/HrcU family type III secretion system export apparatus switch protein [Nocardioides flavescens]MXG87969.1 flagellar type III secretion system protein FlhB [Nocardioides flavescens]
MTGEKTEKATPKKQKENRKEGQVPRTPDLGAWSALLLASMGLPWMVRHEFAALQDLFRRCLLALREPTTERALQLLADGGAHAFVSILVLGSVIMLVGVAGALAQGGFYLATKLVKPSAKKLNPVSGMKRLFGPQALWEGAKTLLKSAAVFLLVWKAVAAMVPLLGAPADPDRLLAHTADQALGLIRVIAITGLLMAVLDYLYQRHRVGKQAKMSKEDVKQEHKNSEGDPLVKSAIRSRQLAAARNRMMADVPEADVVLVNPTHVAVALRYDPAKGAPKVVARGAGAIATRIREKATEARVPLVRDVPLARALYSSTHVGQEIPAELFAAVAQVLAFVISRRTRGQHGGEHRSPRRETDVPDTSPASRRAAGARRAARSEADLPAAVPGKRAKNSSAPALTGR